LFSGVSWQSIGPQPLRIDNDALHQGGGPDSGEVVDIAIDPSGNIDQIIYIATNNGGVWKSVDGGVNWRPKTDFMPSLSMGCLALDPIDSQIVYAGTGNQFDGGNRNIRGAGVYKSIDGGDTWTLLSSVLFTGAHIIRIVIPTSNVLLVATNNGLFRSVDGGVSFGANAPSFNDSNPVLTGTITDLALDKMDPATVYACAQGVGIFVSTDGGITFPAGSNLFTATNGGATLPLDWISFAQAVSDPTVMYALVTDSTATPQFKGLFDIGRNIAANRTFTYGACQDTGIEEAKAGLNGNEWRAGVNGDGAAIVVDPQNAARAYGTDVDNFVTTNDGGTNWTFPTAAATGLPAATQPPGTTAAGATALGVDPNSSTIVYVGNGTRLFRSTNTAATFTVMRDFTTLSATAAAITAFATTAQDSKVLMVGCADGTVFRTTNADQGAASTWTQMNITNPPVDQATGNAQAVSAIAIDPTDAKVAAVTYGGINSNITDQALTKHVFFSADVTTTALTDIGGTSGGNIDESVPNLPVHTVAFDHSTSPHSIIIGCDFSVLRTTDGGSTWHIYGTGIPATDCTSLAADYSLSPPLIRLGTYGRGAYELTRLAGPRIFVSANLAFGDVAQGTNSNLTFDIFNIGDATLTITNIADPTAPATPVFSLVAPPALPFDVAPGGHATVTVGFAPTAPGKQLTMFSVQSNDATHPVFGIPMSGFAAFAGPRVTGIVPSQGPAAGGTAVKIHGSGFTGATAVRFGALAATGMTVDSDTQISAVTPAGGGQVDVVVVTPSGATAVNPASHFSYLGATVSITGLNPSQGSETGGTPIVITGIGFSGATQVLFGGFAASGFTLNGDTQI
jgi:hypothetical protein